MSLTSRIAEYITTTGLEDFPPDAIDAAKAAIIDCLGCALAGSREPLADVLCDYITGLGGVPSSTVIGRGFKTNSLEAALINGAMSHALDYDDVTFITKTHPSAALIPGALPLAEEIEAVGSELLLSYLVGFEVACAVGDAISPAYFDDLGWHPTGPLGTLGAAAAAARLLRLDPEQTAMAVSLAASQASGLRQNFGTMTKPYHAGAACRAGVNAAKLVQAGVHRLRRRAGGPVRIHEGLLRRQRLRPRQGRRIAGQPVFHGGVGHRDQEVSLLWQRAPGPRCHHPNAAAGVVLRRRGGAHRRAG